LLGGASVDEMGGWAPEPSEAVHLKSDETVIDLPAVSAAVVFFNE